MLKHNRNSKRIHSALSIARTLSPNPNVKSTLWRGINEGQIYKELVNRIQNPESIDQYDTNTCGPAAYWYILAYYQPERYAKAIVELYKKGETKLGSVTLKPDKRILGNWDASRIAAIDWLALASLKNNTSPDYDKPQDTFDGVTMPKEVQNWVSSTGWKVTGADTNLFFGKGIKEIQAASKAYSAGNAVYLFVKAKSVGNVGKSLWFGVDHWAVLTSTISVRNPEEPIWINIGLITTQVDNLDDYYIDFTIYTWGRETTVGNNSINMTTIPIQTVGDFKRYFYGYIAVKPDTIT